MPDRPPRRVAKPVTPAVLEGAALFYLERFATSSANLRRVLLGRVRRSAVMHGTDPAAGAAAVDALVARFLATGLLNDRAYAEAKAASLHRRGTSARLIAGKLAAKGLDRDMIAQAMGEDDGTESRPGGDLAAAAAFARRRHLGPYRTEPERTELRQKDLGSLARAGFSRSIAETVLDCADSDSVAVLLAEHRR